MMVENFVRENLQSKHYVPINLDAFLLLEQTLECFNYSYECQAKGQIQIESPALSNLAQ